MRWLLLAAECRGAWGCVPQPASTTSEQLLQNGEEFLGACACSVDSQSGAEGLTHGTGTFPLKGGLCSNSHGNGVELCLVSSFRLP